MTDYVLEILDGDRAGHVIPLGQDTVTIGRKESNTLALADEKVSGQHAEIVAQAGGYLLRDLGSRNGTFLDGRKVEEIVLSNFDVFQIGRVHLQFRAREADGLAMHRIDQDRLQQSKPRRGGVIGLLAAAVLLAGAGIYYKLGVHDRADDAAESGRTAVIPRVAGNKLPIGTDDCEDASRWQLRVSGAAFELGDPAHSGTAALLAVRGGGEGASSADHALARLAEPVRAVHGESLRLTGHLRTAGGARAALRLRFTSSVEESELALCSGTTPAEYDDYTDVELELPVPPSMDRVAVEVLALLPSEDSEVLADDLALVKSGQAQPIDVSAGPCNLIGTGAAIALRSGPAAVITGVAPLHGEGLAGLARAGLAGFSDAGATLVAEARDGGFHIEGPPPELGTQLLLSLSAAASGVRTRGSDGVFRMQSGDFEVTDVDQLLFGSGPTRVLVRTAGPCAVSGQWVGDRFALAFPSGGPLDLVVSFETERAAALEALRTAREAVAENEPGAALDILRKLVDELPHDAAVAADAQRLRGELLSELDRRLEQLAADHRAAEFFRTRGSFARIADELAALVSSYGENNLPHPEEVAALRQQVATQLDALDAARSERSREKLEELAAVFEKTGAGDLEALVKAYIEKHHPH
jgi:pSer/pThr/pTyr-binding forkhead associated (FHA) protein